MHKKILYCLILSVFFLMFCSAIPQSYRYEKNYKNNNLKVKPKSSVSGTNVPLPYGGDISVGRDAHDNIQWNFTGSKSYIGIKCLIMDYYNYEIFKQGGPYSGGELSSGTLSSDSGIEQLGTDTTWYIIFINEDSNHETTNLNYTVKFDEDIDSSSDKDVESTSNENFFIDNIYSVYFMFGILFMVNTAIGLIFFLPNYVKNITKKSEEGERIIE